jgi:diguanylate cyclase (GGDEF)-like protein
LESIAPAADWTLVKHLLAWLTDNVRNAAEKCGARGASVYVPTPWNDAAPGFLLHVGAEPLPELRDLTQAQAFAHQADAWYGDRATNTRELTMLPSESVGGCLIPIPMLAAHWRGASSARVEQDSEDGQPRHRRLADEREAPPIVGWLGLRFVAGPGPLYFAGGWQSLLELASALASTYVCFYGIVTDPVTGLPGRAELQGTLRLELERATSTGHPFSLLFVRFGGLEEINETFGSRTGDAVLRECLDVLQRTLRSSDVIMRYGGAIFALPLRDVAATGAMVVAGKLHDQLRGRTFLDRGLSLSCAIGVTSLDDAGEGPLQPFDVLRRADQALAAASRDDEGRPVLWRADGDLADIAPFDPLLGVFTGQSEKDYRNMRLLWEVLQVLANDPGDELADAAVAKIFSLFGALRAALFTPGAQAGSGNALQLIAGRRQSGPEHRPWPLEEGDLTLSERALNDRAFSTGEPQFATMDDAMQSVDGGAVEFAAAVSPPLTALALPLQIERRVLGTLYVVSRGNARRLEHGDLPVLTGVATHLALALDRASLAAQSRVRARQEEARLRAEVERLQTAVEHANLVFCSQEMKGLLETTRRVATTDATVLVTGESGTGKEMLAHTVHALSPRQGKPFVIVDCGAIPASLIDSELFGRERGAYTGAERRASGRLMQADGGTVFLDEIGELPLEVQAKLLRFVQEHTVTMVGSTTAQRIDVRIIAATNRDLEQEVRAGRFREDLFHRLHVVRLRIPPLRGRRDDIPLLALRFLETFARQYRKPVRGLTAEAEVALRDHTWPGNVRELQNTILQAVVLAVGDRITVEDLRLPEATATPDRAGTPDRAATLPVLPIAAVSPAAPATPAAIAPAPDQPRWASPMPGVPSVSTPWQTLSDRLRDQIAATRGDAARPIGKWLGYEVVLQADKWADGIMARAATRVGLPDTTFVRRLRQAQGEILNLRHPETWPAVRMAIVEVLQAPAEGDGSGALADRIDDLLFGLVVAESPGVTRAAALMGLSAPTIKRRMIELTQRQAACA